MQNNHELNKRVELIEQRNARVELDKKWETSWTRRLAIAVLTYAVVIIYLIMIENDAPWINALVPSMGFLLSTLALGKLRQWWTSRLQGG